MRRGGVISNAIGALRVVHSRNLLLHVHLRPRPSSCRAPITHPDPSRACGAAQERRTSLHTTLSGGALRRDPQLALVEAGVQTLRTSRCRVVVETLKRFKTTYKYTRGDQAKNLDLKFQDPTHTFPGGLEVFADLKLHVLIPCTSPAAVAWARRRGRAWRC